MKRIAIMATLIVVCASVAAAQSATPSLAEVAKQEEARRKSTSTKKPAKVFTNSSLSGDGSVTTAAPAQPSSSTSSASTGSQTSGNKTASEPTIPGGQGPAIDPNAKKDQAYWAARMTQARTELSRTQMFADSLQTKINSLKTDFVNRDNRVEREKIQQELNTALAELERLKKEVVAQQKAITGIEEEARRANVPSGWLRPSS